MQKKDQKLQLVISWSESGKELKALIQTCHILIQNKTKTKGRQVKGFFTHVLQDYNEKESHNVKTFGKKRGVKYLE